MVQPHASQLPESYCFEGLWLSFWVIKIRRYGLKHGDSFIAAVERAVATVMLASSRSATGPYWHSPEAQTKQSRGNTHLWHRRVQHFCQAILVEKSSMTLWCTSHSSQFYVISKLRKGTLWPITQILNEDVKLSIECKKPCSFSNCDLIVMIYWRVLNKGTGFKSVPS